MRKIIPVIVLASVLGIGGGFYCQTYDYVGELQQAVFHRGVTITNQEGQIWELAYYLEHDEKIIDDQQNIMGEMSDTIAQLRGDISSLEDQVGFWQNNYEDVALLYDELEALRGYREFGSIRQLKDWLWDDPTSEHPQSVYYDCDDYAEDLTRAAVREGYWIGLYLEGTHCQNFTIIGNDVYLIEPQTDHVEFWGFVD